MKSALFCIVISALIFALAPSANAQPTLPADSLVKSPEVSADRKITVRLKAPGAKVVRVTGDFIINGAAMTKDADGVWSYTTGPMAPGLYGYSFTVDGVRMVDPGDLFISSGAGHLKSYVEIPADKNAPDFWEQRDVPHGVVHENLYKNPTLGNRRVVVYTPPGYDPAGGKMYPAIYLYHGATDNETYWMHVGRANFIMDNLIADGKAAPAICIACFGHTSIPPGPEEANGILYDEPSIEADLLHSIIPLVEKEYKVSSQSKDRAILGFSSMGGYHALTIGLNNPTVFGYVAGFSSGFRANQDLDANFKPFLTDLEKNKAMFKLIRVEVGSNETGNVAPSQRVDQYLTAKGVKHEFILTQGGIHSWLSWRGYFRDFMMAAFKD